MSDTLTDTSSRRSKTPTMRSGGATKFERDITAAINRGVTNCRNIMHWESYKVPDDDGNLTWSDVRIKSPRRILKIMQPGPARCMCERQATQWAWTGDWNHKGMYTTQWVLAGQEQKGIPTGKDKEVPRYSAKKVFPLNSSLSEAKLQVLINRFPEWHFVNSSGSSHDHPVAHYSTKLASERLMDKLPKGTADKPKVYIDLHGNPASNAAFMRRNPGVTIVTLVECITAKDHVNRATKWGPRFDADGMQQWYDDIHVRDIPTRLADMGGIIDGFISVHTACYYSAEEISALLSWAPNAVMYASMHKFDGVEGTLNDGEQSYSKKRTHHGMWVTQRNVKTRERYEHPDNSMWFDHGCKIVGEKAFGWTMGELCDETYYFVVVNVPVSQARISPTNSDLAENTDSVPATTGTAQTRRAMLMSRQVEVKLCGASVRVAIEPRHVDFFDDMRKCMIGRARNHKQYQDHVSRCKVAAKGLMSDRAIPIESQQLSDLSRLSFMIDFEDSYEGDKRMFSETFATTILADHLYKNGNGLISMGALSTLSDMLMSAAEGKNLSSAAMRAAKTGVTALQRRNVLNTV